MMRRNSSMLATAVVLAFLSVPAFSGGATYCVNCSTIFEQIAEEGTAVEQLAKQAAQLQEQIQVAYDEARNLQGLPLQQWRTVQGQVDQLIQIAAQAQGLGYGSQDIVGEFQRTYGADAGTVPTDYLHTLQHWTSDTNSQIVATLEQYHLDAGRFVSSQGALQAVEDASQTSAGRMQVLQAANQISGMEVNQIELLRQETLAGNSAMLSYASKRNNEDQQDRNIGQQWLDGDRAVRPFL